MSRTDPVMVEVVGEDEPTLALVETLRRSGSVRLAQRGHGGLVVIGIDEAATHTAIDDWGGSAAGAVAVVAPPFAADPAGVEDLVTRFGPRVVLGLPYLYAPGLGRLLAVADEVNGPLRIAVTVTLPVGTAARHATAWCRGTGISLAVTVAAPARPVDVRHADGGGPVSLTFDDGSVATVAASTAQGPLAEIQLAGAGGTARLELAPDIRLERDGDTVDLASDDPLAAAGFAALASAALRAARGDRRAVRAGAGFAREVVGILGGGDP